MVPKPRLRRELWEWRSTELPIDTVNRMSVQVDNMDIQVDRELSAEGLGRMITSSYNGVVGGFFYRFATGRKRPEAVIRMCLGNQYRVKLLALLVYKTIGVFIISDTLGMAGWSLRAFVVLRAPIVMVPKTLQRRNSWVKSRNLS
jgi:hypothetical protein